MARRRRVDRTMLDIRRRRYRQQARTVRFIPDSDSDFAHMARNFATHIQQHRERLGVDADQASAACAAVEAFREALARTIQRDYAGPKATAIKNNARAEAEKIIRTIAAGLRGKPESMVNATDRLMLNIGERPTRLKQRNCPESAPVLRFAGSSHKPGMHVLEYRSEFESARGPKPQGAARLELFVELVPPEFQGTSNMPVHPGDLRGGVCWYVRSFTTSRFEVEYPVRADGVPMLVVYWGRWADAKGGVGPFSKACVTRIEGKQSKALYLRPDVRRQTMIVEHVAQQLEAKQVIVDQPYALPAGQREVEREDAALSLQGMDVRMLEAATVRLLKAG